MKRKLGLKPAAIMGRCAMPATLRSKELGGGQPWGEKRRTKHLGPQYNENAFGTVRYEIV